MTQDTKASIFSAIGRFFSGTMLSRISGLARDVAMAYCFGTTSQVAAFLVAFRFSHLLRRVFGEGALQNAFIPSFESKRQENAKAAGKFFIDLKASLLLILIFVAAILILFLFGLNYMVNFSQGNQEIIRYTIWLMPSLIFICLFGLNAGFLQAHHSYFLSAVAPAAFNIVWIIGAFLSVGLPADLAMQRLSLFVILSCLLQWAITLPKSYQFLRQDTEKIEWSEIRPFSAQVRQLLKPFSLAVTGVAAAQINSALDPLFARFASDEGPAYLWYALRIQQLPIGLFAVAAGAALLPPLSRASKKGDDQLFSKFLRSAVFHTSWVMVACTLFLIFFGSEVIKLLFERGDFNANSAASTNFCLSAYALGLLPQGLVLTLAPACFAKGNYRSPAIASALAVALNVVLNAIFVFGMGLGAVSVALATSGSSLANALFLFYTLYHLVNCTVRPPVPEEFTS